MLSNNSYNYNSGCNLSFGKVILSNEAKRFVSEKFSKRQSSKLSEIIENQACNPHNIFVHTIDKTKVVGHVFEFNTFLPVYEAYTELVARVNDKIFNARGFFNRNLNAVKKASKYANQLREECLDELHKSKH